MLSIEEVERVLNLPDTTTALGVRDRAMQETLYSTGIRRMEIVGLQQRDVDYDRGALMIRHGKGKKDRMIPIGDRALAWVARYYRDEVRPELAIAGDDRTLFLTVLSVDCGSSHVNEPTAITGTQGIHKAVR